jgi:hypothetical protein
MVGKKPDPQTTEEGDRISRMELELESRLSPVRPDPEFIRHLHTRLTTPSNMGLEPETPLSDLFIALAISGGGILILVGVLRLVYEVLKMVGVIRTGKLEGGNG